MKKLRSNPQLGLSLIGVVGLLGYWFVQDIESSTTAVLKSILHPSLGGTVTHTTTLISDPFAHRHTFQAKVLSSFLFHFQATQDGINVSPKSIPPLVSNFSSSNLLSVGQLNRQRDEGSDIRREKRSASEDFVPVAPPSNELFASTPQPPLGTTDIVYQVEGVLEAGDLVLPWDSSFYDEHAFEGHEGQPVIITLESEDFDTYLILVSPNHQLINENDDISDQNSNSSLTTILPVTGTYLAVANSFDSTGQGSYTLTVRAIVRSSEETESDASK